MKPFPLTTPRLLVFGTLCALVAAPVAYFTHPSDSSRMDTTALPQVPAGFEVRMFAKEPLVGHPSALAFDRKGRLFVGMGSQYRMPTPETPGDRVMILLDTDGDGVADQSRAFATGLNSIQGLAWHGRDLWIANAPDLTIARDLNGDDEADEYVRVYTDLGNLEHALHGLVWAPDGKLYMTKGNSKGLTQPGRIAPKPFRELWGVNAPDGAPDFPPPMTFGKGTYRHAYQDPDDDWGREGGFLRCNDMGTNLEIIARGLRNPFDIVFDSGFNWLGTDNDQTGGDRIVMPFKGAHFGWGHGWSAHWTDERNPPTVPVSGPLFGGSSTGVVFYDAPQFPPEWRGLWLMNDFAGKNTYAYRPQWDGALIQPTGGVCQNFVSAGRALYRPTDMEVGPDGAVWVLGWGKQYNRPEQVVRGLLGRTDDLEGRVFRVAWKSTPLLDWCTAKRNRPLDRWSFAELAEDLGSHLPIWRLDAQEELLRRGATVQADLLRLIDAPGLSMAQETWALWTLGRMDAPLPYDRSTSLNRRIQTLRIHGERTRPLPNCVADALHDEEPRIRFAAAQAIRQARDVRSVRALQDLAAVETDRLTYYVAWGTLRDIATTEGLRIMLKDPRDGVRRGALLALADLGQISIEDASALIADPATADVAALWLAKRNGNPLITFEPEPGDFEREVEVYVAPGLKPSVIHYTLDGSTPTELSPVLPESKPLVLHNTTRLRAVLCVGNKPVGEPADALFTKRTSALASNVLLQPRKEPTTVKQVMAVLETGQSANGPALFTAAGCANCHRADGLGRQFGPDLSRAGERHDPEYLVRSILTPNGEITQGFGLLSVVMRDGASMTGVLREETDLHLTLVQTDGRIARAEKALIRRRESLHTSPMPSFDRILSPRQVADLVTWLLAQKESATAPVLRN